MFFPQINLLNPINLNLGYGNISPRTDKGKLMTIVYAIIGIPLMLLYLTNIGDILAKSFRYVYGGFCSLCKQNSQLDKRRYLTQKSISNHSTITG